MATGVLLCALGATAARAVLGRAAEAADPHDRLAHLYAAAEILVKAIEDQEQALRR